MFLFLRASFYKELLDAIMLLDKAATFVYIYI